MGRTGSAKSRLGPRRTGRGNLVFTAGWPCGCWRLSGRDPRLPLARRRAVDDTLSVRSWPPKLGLHAPARTGPDGSERHVSATPANPHRTTIACERRPEREWRRTTFGRADSNENPSATRNSDKPGRAFSSLMTSLLASQSHDTARLVRFSGTSGKAFVAAPRAPLPHTRNLRNRRRKFY